MSSMFAPVTKKKTRLRMAIDGPSGSGKTYTALRFAFAIAGEKGRVAVIDTEHHTASKYAGEAPDGIPWQWDGVDLEHFSPSTYAQVIKAAGDAEYDVLVIDSLSHAWMGAGGALDQVDQKARKAGSSGGNFGAWRDVTPQHRDMVDAIIRSPCHVIVTLRTKMEYALEQDEKTGRTKVRKVGTKPIQREGVEYEFDVILDMDLEHTLVVSKTRCSAVDGQVANKPTGAFVAPLMRWLSDGVEAPPAGDKAVVVKSTWMRVETTPGAPETASPGPATNPSTPAPEPPTKPPTKRKGVVLGKDPACDDERAIRIRGLCRDLGWKPDQLRAVLAKVGASKIAELKASQAEALIEKLSAKLIEREGKEAF